MGRCPVLKVMTSAMTVLVTGASGDLGSAVVPRLTAAGHVVRPMSRRARPGWVVADLAAGTGLHEAVRGVDAIVHLASAAGRGVRRTDVVGTRRLFAAAAAAGVRHGLYMSIVGVDRVPLGYYRAKLAAEEEIQGSGVPFTILRGTQFPALIDSLLTVSSRLGPLVIDRSLRIQPVHVADVADRIAELLAGPPVDGILEVAGPETLTLGDLAQAWLTARGSRRPVWPVRLPGRLARSVRAGGLTSATAPAGKRTWQDYLDDRY